jgi:hypothetical protein
VITAKRSDLRFRLGERRDSNNLAGYLAAVFLVRPPVKAVVFILVQQGLFGVYLGAAFAPNHKGMPILDASDRTDFLRRH